MIDYIDFSNFVVIQKNINPYVSKFFLIIYINILTLCEHDLITLGMKTTYLKIRYIS